MFFMCVAGHLGAFFVGFHTRAIFAALIIGGQFLLYDLSKRLFRVTHADLSQRADVLTTALRTEKLPMLQEPRAVGASGLGRRIERRRLPLAGWR